MALAATTAAIGAASADASNSDTVNLRQLDAMPKVLKQARPKYPLNMRKAGLVGEVIVGFIVDTNGNVRLPYPVSSNNPYFERSAIDAVMQWKFEPGRKDGRLVNTRMQVPIVFRIMDADRPDEPLWSVSKGKDHAKLPEEFRWDDPPVPVATAFPVYPHKQALDGKAGEAKVQYVVGLDGKIILTRLLSASAPEFGWAAMAAIDVWRFRPAQKNGKPCYATLVIEYDFNLNRPSGASVPIPQGTHSALYELKRKQPRIVGASELDAKLKPLSIKKPTYPSAMQDKDLEGEATIEIVVDERGDAHLPRIVAATTTEFGYAAAQAVAGWIFTPPTKKGKAVMTRVHVPIVFGMKKDSSQH